MAGETPVSDSLCQPVRLQCSTGSQCRCVTVWVLVNIWTVVVMSRGQGEEHRKVSSRTRPWAGWLQQPREIVVSSVGGWVEHNCPGREMRNRVRSLELPELVWVCSIHPCSQLCTCAHVYVGYSRGLCACTYWGKLLSLVTACIWEKDGAASPLLAAGLNPS